MTRRIAILSSSRLMAAQLAYLLVDHPGVIDADKLKALDRESVPTLKLADLPVSATPSLSGRTHKGKRVAQWKQERNR